MSCRASTGMRSATSSVVLPGAKVKNAWEIGAPPPHGFRNIGDNGILVGGEVGEGLGRRRPLPAIMLAGFFTKL